MSAIKGYLAQLDKFLNDVPFKLLTNVQSENRGDAALYIKGEIIFTDKSELHFKEYFIAIPTLKKLAYTYHYQTHDKKLIFRYDNAEHYTEIETYPHHKHVENNVLPSKNVDIKEIVSEIVRLFAK
ncbi:MAG: hypothetical protein E3K32_07655 [wastewater metagenome]|nr:hypothetical protein [Candidatus Loosdrechtia aerotolerans]